MSNYTSIHKFLIGLSLVSSFSLFSCQSEEEVKRQQYVAEGFELYKNSCMNCHQAQGEGMAKLYPPLANADFLTEKNKALVICGIRHGFQQPLTVNGQVYHQTMPGNAALKALDIAVLTTFLYNEWGKEKKITDVQEVEKALAKCP
ncbi:cytochrome c [Siphonobacter sp. SORGH_AS_1065]|uniref:c-type cytochrome n=1 Tax=Siphonobacter sp. SORGH_AS_1065 TaxID=3041795 RepID=UPI002784FBD0|nr:cytochrome c [Siphonobacter sp. SORGH_AS_1065]MDQ1087405.1 mono/diheme cytochrome c family protein [Siphonobacter sp. SORGH_AS_1065]